MREIPVYDWDGRLIGSRPLKVVEAMVSTGLLSVQRNRRGVIGYAVRRTPGGDPGMSDHLPGGMHSTHIERLPSGRRCWSF
jgi:hypothetical protein